MGMCYEYKNDIENAKRCYMKVRAACLHDA